MMLNVTHACSFLLSILDEGKRTKTVSCSFSLFSSETQKELLALLFFFCLVKADDFLLTGKS